MSNEVAVIIPTHNRSDLLAITLKNLQHQTHHDLEIVVVDDASSDDTPDCLREWQLQDSRITSYRLDQAGGACRARNLGAEKSRAPYLCFLDSDDLIHPDKFAIQLEELEAEPFVDATVCQMAHFETNPNEAELLWNTFVGDTPRKRFLGHDPVWGIHGPLWRREAYMKTGGFDDSLPMAQEYDLYLRALLGGASFQLRPNLVAFCRRHSGPAISVNRDLPRLQTLNRVFTASIGRIAAEERSVLAVNFLWLAKQAGQLRNAKLAWGASAQSAHLGLSIPITMRLCCVLAAWTGRYRFVHWVQGWADSKNIDLRSRESWYLQHRIDEEPNLVRFEVPEGAY